MSVSETLRDCAFCLRNTGQQPVEGLEDAHGYSHYICDVLGLLPGGAKATQYLYGLGMANGFEVFAPRDWASAEIFSREVQHERMAWLFFAADLADELGEKWVDAVVREVL